MIFRKFDRTQRMKRKCNRIEHLPYTSKTKFLMQLTKRNNYHLKIRKDSRVLIQISVFRIACLSFSSGMIESAFYILL